MSNKVEMYYVKGYCKSEPKVTLDLQLLYASNKQQAEDKFKADMRSHHGEVPLDEIIIIENRLHLTETEIAIKWAKKRRERVLEEVYAYNKGADEADKIHLKENE